MFALNVSRIGVVFLKYFYLEWTIKQMVCLSYILYVTAQRSAEAKECSCTWRKKSSIVSKPHLVIDHEVVYDWPITKQRWIRPFQAFYIGILNTNHVSKFSKKSVMMFSQAALLIILSPVELSSRRHAYIILTLKPHFYIIKLGFTGVYINFLISAQNIDCGYSWEPPRRGGSNEYHNLCFEQKYENYQSFYLNFFSFWRWIFE